MSSRLLLLGGSGQVGTELRALARAQSVEVIAPGRDQLDLKNGADIERIVGASHWSGVINAAAYTDVDGAESEQQVAFAVNAEAPGLLAAATGRGGVPLIHISTDYVFDGRKGAPYVEGDQARPLNIYGSSKLAGEAAVRSQNPRHIVLRTSWVYSPFGRNFVKTILSLAAERDRIAIVADQRGCPTAARDVARACLDIALRCAASPQRAPYGLYHFAGAGDASRFELAQAVVASATRRLGKLPDVFRDGTNECAAGAVRPTDTRLDCSAVFHAFGVKPRHWREGLREAIDRVLSGASNGI
jgi:dTDP-4-dehydrorhamnose reductase